MKKRRFLSVILGRQVVFLTVTLSSYPALAQTVFVANFGSNDVSVIDAASNTVISTLPVGVQPTHVEVSPDGARVYVSNQGSDTVSVIDVASLAVVATIPVGDAPLGVAASPDNLSVYVTHNSGPDGTDPMADVWVIDVASLTASVAFSLPNQAIAQPKATFHPNGTEIWFSNGCGDGCTRRVSYPGHIVIGDLPLETAGSNAGENHISFVPGTNFLYAAHSCGCCGHFDRSQHAPSIAFTGRRYEDGRGGAQWTVAAPTGGIVYLARVTHCVTPSSVIRKESAVSDSTMATLTIPEFFTGVGAITPDGARLYITTVIPGGGSPSVMLVDTTTMTVVATIPVGTNPSGIAISPADQFLTLAQADARYAQLAGASFTGDISTTGNLAVAGTVMADRFVGDGSGLTAVRAATAGTATTAGFANDCGALSGVPGTSFARLDIPNSFNGNQTVAGNIAAGTISGARFFGEGSGLTNVNAATATTAGFASNCAMLGGAAANLYARLDMANSFNGNQTVAGDIAASGSITGTNLNASGMVSANGSLKVGGGTPIVTHLSARADPGTFGLLQGQLTTLACAVFQVPLQGATDGDTVGLGVPGARMAGGNLVYSAWVSAADTASIQVCNPSRRNSSVGSGAIRIDVWKH